MCLKSRRFVSQDVSELVSRDSVRWALGRVPRRARGRHGLRGVGVKYYAIFYIFHILYDEITPRVSKSMNRVTCQVLRNILYISYLVRWLTLQCDIS